MEAISEYKSTSMGEPIKIRPRQRGCKLNHQSVTKVDAIYQSMDLCDFQKASTAEINRIINSWNLIKTTRPNGILQKVITAEVNIIDLHLVNIIKKDLTYHKSLEDAEIALHRPIY